MTGESKDESESICVLVYRPRTRRMRHWHWPRRNTLSCARAAEFAQEHKPSVGSRP